MAGPKPLRFPAVIAEKGETLVDIARRELRSRTPAQLHRDVNLLAQANHMSHLPFISPGDLIVIGGVRPLPWFISRSREF